jgi:hypothetical protein
MEYGEVGRWGDGGDEEDKLNFSSCLLLLLINPLQNFCLQEVGKRV